MVEPLATLGGGGPLPDPGGEVGKPDVGDDRGDLHLTRRGVPAGDRSSHHACDELFGLHDVDGAVGDDERAGDRLGQRRPVLPFATQSPIEEQ